MNSNEELVLTRDEGRNAAWRKWHWANKIREWSVFQAEETAWGDIQGTQHCVGEEHWGVTISVWWILQGDQLKVVCRQVMESVGYYAREFGLCRQEGYSFTKERESTSSPSNIKVGENLGQSWGIFLWIKRRMNHIHSQLVWGCVLLCDLKVLSEIFLYLGQESKPLAWP